MNKTNPNHDQPHNAGMASVPVRQRSWVRVLLMLVIFGSGAIVGTCATLVIIRQQVLQRIHHPEDVPAKVAARLTRLLDLDDTQAKQVQSILSERQHAIQQLRRKFQPQLERELDQVEEEVATVLDDQQRLVWHDKFQELRSTWLPVMPKVVEDQPIAPQPTASP